ncbi:anti-phage deoxyguanosine triphosphatase [Shewanella sp. YIC-542]|uniref:anti-phage deoxyguanosine triphosphatase n=1 Tax=Shewanella mytili TaxID=3377111 RepID=UPI00398EF509
METTPWLERREQDCQRHNDHRTPYQRDRARIMHSAAFRRLQAKTQVLGVGMNDFYRTRLTHSLEVAQIGTGIAAQLRHGYPQLQPWLDSMSLIESLCLAHDIGHPPYGHGGESALNYMMRSHGGFEGNGQTFRILAKLEPYTEHVGMNLTRRTLLGIMKYPALADTLRQPMAESHITHYRQLKPSQWPPVKGIFNDDAAVFHWVLAPLPEDERQIFIAPAAPPNGSGHQRTRHKSFDCSIMELADDIAYAVHDLEDAIVMGIVSRSQWRDFVVPQLEQLSDIWMKQYLTQIDSVLFSEKHYCRKDAIGTLVNALVTAIGIEEKPLFTEPLLHYQAVLASPYDQLLEILKQFVLTFVVRKPEIQILEYKGQQIVMELFEALASDPMRLLPLNTQARWQCVQQNGGNSLRVIADYIAGMTDEFAARLHQQLFSPRAASLMDFNY